MTKAAYYGRVSTAEQVEGTSLESQRDRCLAAIDAHGWTCVAEFVDGGVSGAKASRPQLDRLMAGCRSSEIDAVVVAKLDRFGRSMRHLSTLLGELDDLGVTFVSVAESFDSSTPAGRLQRNMLGSFAEFERDQIRERTSSGRNAVVADGFWCGGPPPFGFQSVPAGRHKTLELDEAEADQIRMAASLILDEGLSAYQATKTLNALGMRPRRASHWKEANLKRILRSLTVAGRSQFAAPERRWSDRVQLTERALTIPAILPPDRFEALQIALDARQTGPRQTAIPFYLLSQGVLHGACGARMHGYRRTERDTIWYRCQRRRPGIPSRCDCHPVRAEDAERIVWAKIHELLSDPAQLMSLAAEYLDSRGEQMAVERESLASLEAKIADLEVARTDRAASALREGLDPALLRAAVAQIDEDLAVFRRRATQLRAWRDETANRSSRMQELAALAELAHVRLESLSPEERREILIALGVRVSVQGWETCQTCEGKGRLKGQPDGVGICPTCLATRRIPRFLIEGTWNSGILTDLSDMECLSNEVP